MTEWDNVCILCAKRGHKRRLETGHCCVECASWLAVQVADIARLAADAAAWIAPGSSTGGGSRPVPGSRPPCRVEAIDPENTLVPQFPGQEKPPTVLELLELAEREIREARGMAPYGPASAARGSGLFAGTSVTLVGCVTFLGRQVPWITTTPDFALEDFADMVRSCVRALRQYDRNREERNHGLRCPTELETGTCGYFIAWARDEESVDCPRCRRTWTMEWLLMVASSDDLWLDAEAIANATKMHEQTIRKWARAGQVRKRGLLYSVADVQSRRSLAQAHTA